MIRGQETFSPRGRGGNADLGPGDATSRLFGAVRATAGRPGARFLVLLLASSLIALVGCRSDDDDDDGAPAQTPPTVLSVLGTLPADGATDVVNTARVEVVFSTALDPASVGAMSFAVSGSISGAIQGAYTTADGGATAVFTPDGVFAYEETVDVRVTTDVSSADGARLDAELNVSFTIESDPNPPPPQLAVVETRPADGATDVVNTTAIEVVFSVALDPASVGAGSFAVSGSTSGAIQGAYSLADSDTTAIFSPGTPYAFGEGVQVELNRTLRSVDGASLAEDFTFSFTVESDTNPPPPATSATVVSSTPEAYAQGVGRNASISVLFSHPLDAATVTSATAWLASRLTGRVGVDVALSEGNLRLDLTPVRSFHAGEVLTVHLGTAIDAVGDDVAFGGETFTFRVQSDPLDLAVTEVSVTSAAGTVRDVIPGDVNLDGAIDLVYRVENGTGIHFLLGDGTGALTPVAGMDHGQPILSMQAADIDRDGDLDIVVGTADRTRLYLNRAVEENPGAEALRFVAGPEVIVGTEVHQIAIGDLDHDANLDYVLDTGLGVQVYLGSLTSPTAQTIGDSRRSLSNLVLADLDLDGQLDLIYGDRSSGAVAHHAGRLPEEVASGEEIFAAALTVELSSEAMQIAVDNLLAGSLPEMVVLTNDGASHQGAAFRLLVADGAGGYEVVEFTGAGGPPVDPPANGVVLDSGSFWVADLEGDAHPDVLLASSVLNQVLWLQNHAGEPLPSTGLELLSAPTPWSVVSADLTGDGVEEVLASAMNEIHAVVPKTDEPPPPEDVFRLSLFGSEARQGEVNAPALARITNSAPLDGYEIRIRYDAAALIPTGTNTAGTALETDPPEFVSFEVIEAETVIVIATLMEFQPPFEGRTFPPHDDDPLLRILFDIPDDAPLGDTVLEFDAETALVSAGQSKLPETTSGTMTILIKDQPPPPPTGNATWIVDTVIDSGREGLVEVRGSAERKVDAFTSIVGFDTDILEIREIDLAGSITGELSPELEIPDLRQAEGYFVYTVIFDFLAPFERQGIPASQDFLLFSARFRVRSGTPGGLYPLNFRNEVGSPPLFNIYAFGGESVFPELIGGEVRVRPSTETLFVRGDPNHSGAPEISDAIFIIAHLFRGGARPRCFDAADANDDGEVSLTDVLNILGYVFQGMAPPPPPFPEPGTDPTADNLDCAEGI